MGRSVEGRNFMGSNRRMGRAGQEEREIQKREYPVLEWPGVCAKGLEREEKGGGRREEGKKQVCVRGRFEGRSHLRASGECSEGDKGKEG